MFETLWNIHSTQAYITPSLTHSLTHSREIPQCSVLGQLLVNVLLLIGYVHSVSADPMMYLSLMKFKLFVLQFHDCSSPISILHVFSACLNFVRRNATRPSVISFTTKTNYVSKDFVNYAASNFVLISLTFQSPRVRCNNRSNFQKLYILPTLYVISIYLRTNCDLCPVYRKLISFITEMKRVYCAVRTGSWNKAVYASCLKS
jgi:hypothetical protein